MKSELRVNESDTEFFQYLDTVTPAELNKNDQARHGHRLGKTACLGTVSLVSGLTIESLSPGGYNAAGFLLAAAGAVALSYTLFRKF